MVRTAAFDYLARLTLRDPYVLVRWSDLKAFEYRGTPCPLIGAPGIWKPAVLEAPISITTAPPKAGRPAPYDDDIRDEMVIYRYRGTDPSHRDNVGLRRLMWEKTPLIYFHGIESGLYLAAWPVTIIHDDPASLSVTVDVRPNAHFADRVADRDPGDTRKQYIFAPTKHRLHQAKFRARVMEAYKQRCSICRLGHAPLLDAAHIIPDADEAGAASVRNGLSLCKIHHAAFDSNILGIDPDLIIHVREDILNEIDGPMLKHGIIANHGERLSVVPRNPAHQPSRDGLAERFHLFKRA